jgi:hypothetical protein
MALPEKPFFPGFRIPAPFEQILAGQQWRKKWENSITLVPN